MIEVIESEIISASSLLGMDSSSSPKKVKNTIKNNLILFNIYNFHARFRNTKTISRTHSQKFQKLSMCRLRFHSTYMYFFYHLGASLDFGVFLCANCSGAHRALGPTITRVRSANLDKWQEEWLSNMKIGNS